MMRAIGLAALTVLELPPPDMVTCAAEAGFTHIGLRLIPATPTEVSYATVGDTPIIRATLERLADTGIEVLDIEILRLTPDIDPRDFLPVLETGARLGARNALIAGNDPDEARLTERFAALCELAAPLRIAPCLEPMPWTDVRDFAQGARVLRNAAHANAGLLVDAIHFDRGGSHASEIAAVPPAWLRYAQLCDAPAERPTEGAELLRQARSDRLLPGEGGLDLAGILRALPRETPLSLEIAQEALARTMPALERARRALAATHALLDRLDLPTR
jgi:sugar phosphate isomerase/epimerase